MQSPTLNFRVQISPTQLSMFLLQVHQIHTLNIVKYLLYYQRLISFNRIWFLFQQKWRVAAFGVYGYMNFTKNGFK